jgi:outer membrane protein OmpA-like peptidoglycan-associated protein
MKSVFLKFISNQQAVHTVAALLLACTSAMPLQAQQIANEAVQSRANSAKDVAGTVVVPQGQAYGSGKNFIQKYARVTLYRPAQGFTTGVASISINGHFHTALQLGGYSEVCLEAGSFEIAAQMVKTGGELKNSKDDAATLNPQASQDLYVRVFEYGDGRATLTLVKEEIAIPELKEVRHQLHAVSRFAQAKNCYGTDVEIDEKEEKVTKENITLGADALFEFDRGDINGMTNEGRQSLNKLIVYLQKLYTNGNGVMLRVSGHADPLGSPLFNQRLSEARASAVRRYLIEGGINAQKITTEGKGAEQPVVTTCGKTATPESIECNKPNRRVVVKVQELVR